MSSEFIVDSVKNFYDSSFLYPEQVKALAACFNFVVNKTNEDKIMIMNAPAGCGKSVVVNALRNMLSANGIHHVALAYTGRAATRVKAQTLHSLLYKAIVDEDGNLLRWENRPISDIRVECGDVIIVDESSMIPSKMHVELLQIGVPILYVGDESQLPPINEDKEDTFNAMELDVEKVSLSKVRRFDESSGIGKIAADLRVDNIIKRIASPDVKFVSKASITVKWLTDNHVDAILVGTNKSRKKYINLVRRARGYMEDLPEIGEEVMCLSNSVVENRRINNGDLFIVKMILPDENDQVTTFVLENKETKEGVTVRVHNDCWTEDKAPTKDYKGKLEKFTFGYAFTTFKLQGSQAKNVLYVDENVSFFTDQQKFRYTSVTRAEEKLYIAV